MRDEPLQTPATPTPAIQASQSTPKFFDWLAGQLSRVTSGGTFIPEIDGLRFLAIASVIFHHLVSIYLPECGRINNQAHSSDQWFSAAQTVGQWGWLVKIAYSGHFGVNLFFAISGFILALPFAKRAFAGQPAPGLKDYFLRRVTRIEPPYLLCLILYFLVLLAKGMSATYLFPHLLASMFYAHNLVYGQHSYINAVAWSLEIEIQFYLLVPLLVLIFRLRYASLRRLVLLGLIAWGGWLSPHVVYPSGNVRLMLSLVNFFHYFLVGFLLADLYLHDWFAPARRRWWYDLLTLGGAYALYRILTDAGQYYEYLPLFVLIMFLGCLAGRFSSAVISRRWIALTGGMCYTFYLYHIPVISGLMSRTSAFADPTRPLPLDLLLQAACTLPVVFILCSWWFVKTEKPFMRWQPWRKQRVSQLSANQPAES